MEHETSCFLGSNFSVWINQKMFNWGLYPIKEGRAGPNEAEKVKPVAAIALCVFLDTTV